MLGRLGQWARSGVTAWQPEEADALLYAASALFAFAMVFFLSGPGPVHETASALSTRVLYRQWAALALGPYLAAAFAALFLARRAERIDSGRQREPGLTPLQRLANFGSLGNARVLLFLFVLVGATLVPLSLEIVWRSQQPEVTVVQQAGARLAQGKELYHASVRNGHVVSAEPGVPSFESFFPYLPIMAAFGLPSSTHGPRELTDARIFFSVVTLLVVAGALTLCRGPPDRKMRTLQLMTVLPTAALPLATGGDDMPVVAFLLLAMVLAQRRRPGLSGFVLGVVASMKFTAWPLAALALFAARDAQGRRAPKRMALGMLVVAGPVVVPFLLQNPKVFVDNVILYPLGLAGVASPAASALPGHILVTLLPGLRHVLPLAVAIVGGAVLVAYLRRRRPRTASEVVSLAGWIMLVAILFAPATRVGYLLYPINFFFWAHLLRGTDDLEVLTGVLSAPDGRLLEPPARRRSPVGALQFRRPRALG
ncbi:MAG TPA: glycosyltransferase family 87 protein [Acidimicrobiales bacterium]|nr:glycosyltransferase family 87 protein [Acidimicrobiales bacterium]